MDTIRIWQLRIRGLQRRVLQRLPIRRRYYDTYYNGRDYNFYAYYHNYGYDDYYGYDGGCVCGYIHSEWKDVKKGINTNDDKTVITTNKQDEYVNTGSKERIETESNYQNKLGSNRYAAFSNDNDDDWNTHVSQYVEREENPGRMREIGKATKRQTPKKEEAIRYLPYGSLIKRMSKIGKATKRHAPNGSKTKRISPNKIIIIMDATNRHAHHKIENTTKGNVIDRVETNRFSQHRFATNRNTIKQK